MPLAQAARIDVNRREQRHAGRALFEKERPNQLSNMPRAARLPHGFALAPLTFP
jgi:hypothetical protein